MNKQASPSPLLTRPRWNPYAVGAGIGILSWLVFFLLNKPLGMSTEVSKWGGCVAALGTGWEAMTQNAYWASNTPKIGYSTVFLLATLVGATLSALMSKSFRIEAVPRVWRERFGDSAAKRFVGAFIGGALLLFGARMAGGCTSGHGISGTLQLAVSSWVFFIALFISGIITARILFRKS